MRVLLCGGGTAGHVMPAIAIAEIIEKSFPRATVAFCGRSGGAENEAYLKTKHKLYTIDIQGISRSLSINNIKTVFKLIKSSRTARDIISEFKPDIIIGTGGYVSFPFIRQGQKKKIKTVIHESNVAPGLVTRLLGAKCDKLLLNLEGTKDHLKKNKNTVVVGNPTRHSFGKFTKSEAKKQLGVREGQKLIVSFGGSLGAETMNKAIAEFIKSYVMYNPSVYHIHSTGKAHYSKVKSKYPELFQKRRNISILPYIDDMPTILTAADIAITRSGAITISELCKCGTPSILIPSPNVTANHQLKNAEYMQKKGASILIEENELNAKRLGDEVFKLIANCDDINVMSEKAKKASPKNTDILIETALRELYFDK